MKKSWAEWWRAKPTYGDLALYIFLGILLGILLIVSGTIDVRATQIVAVPESTRFVVVSQQILDSGAKLVIIRDTFKGALFSQARCYAIYEAGVGAVLGRVPCQ